MDVFLNSSWLTCTNLEESQAIIWVCRLFRPCTGEASLTCREWGWLWKWTYTLYLLFLLNQCFKSHHLCLMGVKKLAPAASCHVSELWSHGQNPDVFPPVKVQRRDWKVAVFDFWALPSLLHGKPYSAVWTLRLTEPDCSWSNARRWTRKWSLVELELPHAVQRSLETVYSILLNMIIS